MLITLIVGHPDAGSFNHAVAEVCRQRLLANGHTVAFHDLYKEQFNPVIPASEIPKHGFVDETVKKYCNELVQSDGIIVVHPNWWGQPPAILKGWIDRVIRPGVAYEFIEGDNGEGTPVGLLKAQTGLVFNTSNTAEDRENGLFKDPLETIWKNCIFDLCGVRQFERKIFRIVVTSGELQRKLWLKEAEEITDRWFPVVP